MLLVPEKEKEASGVVERLTGTVRIVKDYIPPLVTVSSRLLKARICQALNIPPTLSPHCRPNKQVTVPDPPPQRARPVYIYIPRNELRRRLIYSRQFVPGLIKHVHPSCAHPLGTAEKPENSGQRRGIGPRL